MIPLGGIEMDRKDANKILVVVGWVCLIAPLILWPVSAFTVAKNEPQVVLGLSWAAVLLSGGTILLQAVTKSDIDSDD